MQNRDVLILDNLDLVEKTSNKHYSGYYYRFPKEDLIGYGNIGLVKSANKFINDENSKYKPFAVKHIKWSIMDGIREMDYLKRGQREKEVCDKAEFFGSDSIEYNYLTSDWEDDTLDLGKIIHPLNDREKQILKLYSEDYDFKEIGGLLNISKQRVYQIYKKGIEKIRKSFDILKDNFSPLTSQS